MRERRDLRAIPLTKFQKVVRTAVSTVVPKGSVQPDGEEVVESYIEHYNCCPPPLFIIIISAIEVNWLKSLFSETLYGVHSW